MKQENRRNFSIAVGLLALFALWTHLVCVVDVQAIGPRGSVVGFAGVNAILEVALNLTAGTAVSKALLYALRR